MNLVLALDIGGTKLAAGVVDSAGVLLCLERAPTRTEAGPEELFGDVVELLDRAHLAAGADGGYPDVVAVGVGCGGPMTADTVSPLNIPAWRGFPLRERIEAELGCTAVVDNDAKAMALAEGWVGAAAGVQNYVGMVVSTGVGGGIVLDGRLLQGAATNAGHIGHVIVAPDGEVCACGACGCLEAEASGTSIARKARRLCEAGQAGDGPLAAEVGDSGKPRAEDVVVAARAGDPCALTLLDEAGAMVGRAVADVANLLDLQLAVVGGGVAVGAGDLLLGPARREAAARARIEHARGLRIVPATLGATAGVVGAAGLVRAAGLLQ